MRKVLITNLAWPSENDRDAYQLLRKIGISYLEIAPSRLWKDPSCVTEKGVREQLDQLAKYDLTPVVMQAILYGKDDLSIFGDIDTKNKTLSYLRKIIDLAARLGVSAIVFGAPKNKLKGDLSEKEAMAQAIEFFKAIGDYSAKKKITFCIEATPGIYGADFIISTDNAMELVKKINKESIRLNLDLGALKTEGGNILRKFENTIPYAGHFHISEPRLKAIELDSELHKSLSAALRSQAYQGGVSVEMLATDMFNPSAIEKILLFVKKWYGSDQEK